MEVRKTDRRVKYTKQVLKQSLLDLMTAGPISKITVKDLCERADINRGTFYTHYQDPYDLLNQIEQELLDDIMQQLSSLKQNSIHVMIGGILISIERNRALCRVLFSEYGDKAYLAHIIDLAKELTIVEWRKVMPNIDENRLQYIYTFISNGSVALIQQWVQKDHGEAPNELAAFIEQLSFQCLRTVAKA